MSSVSCWLIIGEWQIDSEQLLDVETLKESIVSSSSVTDCSFHVVTLTSSFSFESNGSDHNHQGLWKELISSYGISQLPCCVFLSGHELPSLEIASSPLQLLYPPVSQLIAVDTDNINIEEEIQLGRHCYDEMDLKGASFHLYRVLCLQVTSTALFNMACIMQLLDYPTLSVHYVKQQLLLDPNDAISQNYLWSLCTSDKFPRALALQQYEELSQIPDNFHAKTKYSVLTGEGSCAKRGDPNYIREVFDYLAPSFESKLVDHLEYRAPWLLHKLLGDSLQTPSPSNDWRIMDLGCGSGLCGKVFSQYSIGHSALVSLEEVCQSKEAAFIGVDLSPKMIEIAAELNTYNCLLCDDVFDVLNKLLSLQPSASLDLVIAADTFIYVGGLGEMFHLINQTLRNDGYFAFSTEDLDDSRMKVATELDNGIISDEYDIPGAVPGWGVQLLRSARFGHSHQYISQLSDKFNFKIVQHEKSILRREEGDVISGNMYILQKMNTV